MSSIWFPFSKILHVLLKLHLYVMAVTWNKKLDIHVCPRDSFFHSSIVLNFSYNLYM
jgi:hypothetical protein